MAINISDDPARVVAQTIWGEARGAGWNLMQGVANVIANREKLPLRFGEGFIAVCTKPKQFSCWNEGDPNLPLLEDVGPADQQFQEATTLAGLALAGVLPDITGGADSYYDTSIEAPYWATAPGAEFLGQIGNIRFFKTVDEKAGDAAPSLAPPSVIDAPIPIPVSTTEEHLDPTSTPTEPAAEGH